MKKAKGSLTLEAAIVLPIFLSLAISLISVLEMMNLYARVEFALHETARETALMAYPAVYVKNFGEEIFNEEYETEMPDENILNPLVSETLVRTMFTENFGFKNLKNSLIKNGEAGIFFFRSDIVNEKGDIDLIVTYRVEPLFNMFGLGKMTFSNRVKMHSWTGYTREKHEVDEYVYITDNASVYHTRRDCTHLCLTINSVKESEIDKYRNIDRKIYKACKKCGNEESVSGYVYITPYGEAYHTSLSCSGLKRNIYRVRLSEVQGLGECERCMNYKEGEIKEKEEDGTD